MFSSNIVKLERFKSPEVVSQKTSPFNACCHNKVPFQHFNKIPLQGKDQKHALQYELRRT